ncbi:MAG: hypothetical protein IKY23_12550 [Lachnospiraceae bacterium]|nr:hypothetical protein [Lachnospiraceae bacterium]
MQNKFEEYRKKYPEFIYRDYELEKEEGMYTVRYFFEIPGLCEFTPKWSFPFEREVDEEVLRALVFQLGMVESISYWKAACPPKLSVKCGALTKEQANFWKNLYFHGLGEFLFVNGIEVNPEEFISIEAASGQVSVLKDVLPAGGSLVPVGGGKDSVVSLDLLKDEDVVAYCINPSETMRNVIAKSNARLTYGAKRILDARLLELNKQGFLNGHTPFSAIVAFSTVIAAYLTGKQYIVLSNENSANESTVLNSTVNHQYSKSYEFEQDFNAYLRSVVDTEIFYFSFLRPLTEMQISYLFSKAKQYHDVFRSCNVGSKKGIWCCDCAKCLFVYIILSPFLSDEELVGIFGENLLSKESLAEIFKELAGIKENKPFECVGTRREVVSALYAFAGQGRSSLLTDRYLNELQAEITVEEMLKEMCTEHSVPEAFMQKLIRSLPW